MKSERQAELNRQGWEFLRAEQLEEAEKLCARVLRSVPQQRDTLMLFAAVRAAQGRVEEAVTFTSRVLSFAPSYLDGYIMRSKYLQRLGRYDAALADCEQALGLDALSAAAHDNRAHCLQALGRREEALSAFTHALKYAPEALSVHNNRATLLFRLNRYDEAIAALDKAIALAPAHAAAYGNRGRAFQALGRQEEAAASFAAALARAPDSPVAQFNQATHDLLHGDFESGWQRYEARAHIPEQKNWRSFASPRWMGQFDIAGKTILLHAEQGLGDTLQFCRYVPMVEALGARVLLEVPAALYSLMQQLPGERTLLAAGDPLPPFDAHCPLLGLPLAFATRLETIPNSVPYLAARGDSCERWDARLGPRTRPRIGLAWSGSAHHANDHNRTVPLEAFAPLLALDMEFHALQKELRPADGAYLAHTPITFHGDALTDMEETAALTRAMDAVVSVDTSLAHLAGALARPLYVLLPFAPDYRWLLEREDSPWYPTATLLRQPIMGDWATPITRLVAMLSS